jgi:hypothetical protein
MSFWLDVGSVVVQNVEDKVRLVLVRANDSCIAWHVIATMQARMKRGSTSCLT